MMESKMMKTLYRCHTCKNPTKSLGQGEACSKCRRTYALNQGILQFIQDENTRTWDTYWKRIPVYDDILDVLRKIMNVQLRRYLEKKIPSSSITLEPGGGSAYSPERCSW